MKKYLIEFDNQLSSNYIVYVANKFQEVKKFCKKHHSEYIKKGWELNKEYFPDFDEYSEDCTYNIFRMKGNKISRQL